jgi:hypothetical protein
VPFAYELGPSQNTGRLTHVNARRDATGIMPFEMPGTHRMPRQ